MSSEEQQIIPNDALESAIFRGKVRHRRFTPVKHEFDFNLFMLWLKLDELPWVLQDNWQLGTRPWNWGRFQRSNYLSPEIDSIDQAVRNKIRELAGTNSINTEGDVYILGHLRYLGFYFSPLTLYFLKDKDRFTWMLAEVSNTPWRERHYYLVDVNDPQEHPKKFHVSPFNPMEQSYRWRIIPPDPVQKNCLVHIEVGGEGHGMKPVFDASLMLQRQPLNQSILRRVLIRSPIQTASIIAGIHWQALKLFIKRAPLYPHPKKGAAVTGKKFV